MTNKKDKKKGELAKNIILLIVKTFAQIKLYSLQHDNVNKFTELLFQKIKEFLNEYREFELGVSEFSFLMDETVIYTDQQINHSLPFLFYKDGMARLFFDNGLDKTELLDFLEIVKEQSELPAEKSDIVSAMWEKDFPNIRYLAPDDFLETKIGIEQEVKEYSVNKDDLFSGRIELDQEDKQALSMASEQPGAESIQTAERAFTFLNEIGDLDAQTKVLSETEELALERMLQSNRQLSKDKELLSLLAEMFKLENRPEEFLYILKMLQQSHEQLLSRGDYKNAVFNLNNLNKLNDSILTGEENKSTGLKKFLSEFKSQDAIFILQEKAGKEPIPDMSSFLHYLELLGTGTIPLLCDLYQKEEDPLIQQKIAALLRNLGKQDIDLLMQNARDDQAGITREIISIIKNQDQETAIPLLANFFSYKNNSIREESIKALGKFKDAKANKILAAYLSEEEKSLRILAAKNLSYTGDEKILQRVIKLAEDKTFIKKDPKEQKALLDFFGRTGTVAAHRLLEKLLRRAGLFSSLKVTETALNAVAALSHMDTEEALLTLAKGKKYRSAKIKKACQDAFQKHPRRQREMERKTYG